MAKKKNPWPKEISEAGVIVKIYLSPLQTKGGVVDSYIISYYHQGKRVRERITNWEQAWEHAHKKHKELSSGAAENGSFTAQESRHITNALETLAPVGIPITEAARRVSEAERILGGVATIEEAARAMVEQKAKQQLEPVTLREVYEQFMATLMTEEKPGKSESRIYHRSFRYWQDMKQRLGAVAEIFGNAQISKIHTKELEAFLDKVPQRQASAKGVFFTGKFSRTRGRTRNNYRGALCTLFSFARKRGYLPRGVETEAEHILLAAEVKTRKEKADGLQRRIYKPAEMQKILDELPHRWVAFAALGAFAGIRTAEIHRLDWRDVNFVDHFITVEKDQAKVGKRRIVRMSPQLEAWLKPHAQKEGWVCPHYSHDSTLSIEYGKAREKIKVPSVHNGHRHSYASYRLAEIKVPSEVAWEMNTSERKLKDNYLALVNDRELAEWKKVLPRAAMKAEA